MSRMPPPSCTQSADGLEDALDRRDVHRLAGEGAVEIDDVQMPEALRLERVRLRRRIAVEHGRARHVALLAGARARPSFRSMAGNRITRVSLAHHGFHFRKLAISASPSFWLFSGWNCVPAMLSRATIAVTGPP